MRSWLAACVGSPALDLENVMDGPFQIVAAPAVPVNAISPTASTVRTSLAIVVVTLIVIFVTSEISPSARNHMPNWNPIPAQNDAWPTGAGPEAQTFEYLGMLAALDGEA